MISILEKIMSSPIAWAMLALATIGSLAYAVYCQHINKPKKGIVASIQTVGIVKQQPSKIEGLHIVFKDKEVDNVCVSRIAIWNSGNQTILDSDIVSEKPITVALCNDSQILNAEISEISDETNKFSIISISNSFVSLAFDYIDPEEGVVITVTHTGTSQDLSIGCKIKGGLPVKIVRDDQTAIDKHDINRFVFRAVALAFFSVMIFIIFLDLIGVISTNTVKTRGDYYGEWITFISLLFAVITGWYLSIQQIKKKTPKPLRFYRHSIQKN